MKTKNRIEMFDREFNWYPCILKRKNPFGPVIEYSFNQRESYFRIHIVKKEEQLFRWTVEGNIKDKISYNETFNSFEEAYSYMEKKIKKNRLRALT